MDSNMTDSKLLTRFFFHVNAIYPNCPVETSWCLSLWNPEVSVGSSRNGTRNTEKTTQPAKHFIVHSHRRFQWSYPRRPAPPGAGRRGCDFFPGKKNSIFSAHPGSHSFAKRNIFKIVLSRKKCICFIFLTSTGHLFWVSFFLFSRWFTAEQEEERGFSDRYHS